jgi:DNA-binding transcriptional LysR family regulator
MESFAITVFVQVAETRSFVVAGRNLGISASGVGKSITRLEQRLGVRLFHRNTRSVTLTAEGELFLGHARRILAEFEAAEVEFSKAATAPTGRLKIGLPLIAEPFLAVLADFVSAYPDIELDLEFDNRKVDVIEEGFDAVVRSGQLVDSELNARFLGGFRMMLVGAPEYFARRGTPLRPADLGNHACIQFRIAHTGKLQEWQLQRESDSAEIPLRTVVTCNTNEARMHFALRGAGIAYMSDFTVREAIEAGTLVSVLDDYMNVRNVFNLLWPSGRHIQPKMRAFIDFMSQNSLLDKSKFA